jgi:hypothetical protein
MTETSCERPHFPVQTRWPKAGNNPSRLTRRARRSLRSLIGSKRLPRCPSPVSGLSMQIRRPHSADITSIPELGTSIKSP